MKKLTIIITLGRMSLLTVGALELSSYVTRDKELDKSQFDKFQEYNINDYKVSPIVCIDVDGDGNNDKCNPIRIKITYPTEYVCDSDGDGYKNDTCIKQNGVVDKSYNPETSYSNCKNYETNEDGLEECLEYETLYYTSQELEDKRNTWEDNVVQKAINYLNSLDNSNIETEIKPGVDVILKEKKK